MVKLKNPVHPGEVLKHDFLDELGITQADLARACGLDRQRIERVLKGQSEVSTDTALRLARALGTTPEFWLNLQTNYSLSMGANDPAKAAALDAIEPIRQAG